MSNTVAVENDLGIHLVNSLCRFFLCICIRGAITYIIIMSDYVNNI